METKINSRKAVKRPLEGGSNGGDTDKVYCFKVLLPNGASVGLTLRNPESLMDMQDFVKLVREKYDSMWFECGAMSKRRRIDWKGGRFYIEDANDNKMRAKVNFTCFKPDRRHILRLHDGSGEILEKFENMWDLTPDTEMLKELPEDYTFETALADLIDNSLQAVWTNEKNHRRFISVNILNDRISIFDTGPGMDGTDENCIVKWGKIGASLHRSSKVRGIGGKPPYLTPFFGMFGYRGPIASMHLGRCALVTSKTKMSKKVYTLHLERQALLNRSSSVSGVAWRTDSGMREPFDEEIKLSPHGSFTKVEIFEPKLNHLNVSQLQSKLKDIYFPYIQCDEVSKAGKNETPIEFQVNDADLAEVESGEVAITNLYSCNGREFVFGVQFSHRHDIHGTKLPGTSQEANARLKFIYFPVLDGKESIERILEMLEDHGCGVPENFETFVVLQSDDLAWLPCMDLQQKKGVKAQLLRRCCLRVKCFIDTDAGFNPTPSKTDLAHKNPFNIALRNFGSKSTEKEQDVNIKIQRSGKLLSFTQLEKEFQDWILEMHDSFDEEVETDEDEPTLIVGPSNKKALGISSDVVRVHRCLKKRGVLWKHGQKIKILKGACAGCHKKNAYATIEYFLVEGFPGDAGGDARIICKPLDQPGNGCILEVNGENASLSIGSSLSLPVSIIDFGKCLPVETNEWEDKLEKGQQKAHTVTDSLDKKQCKELKVNGVPLMRTTKTQPEEIQSPCSASKSFAEPLEMAPPEKHLANMMVLQNYEKGTWNKICRYSAQLGSYEGELKKFEVQRAEIEQVITDLQASLGPQLMEQPDCFYSKEEMIRQIEIHSDSAAAVICSLSRNYPLTLLMMDILGVVGLLGTVRTSMLSSILAKYLGKKKMLAIVCRSFEAARALERFRENGEVDHNLGINAEVAAFLRRIKDGFLVMCLDGLRAYRGKFIENNPQRKLALQEPILPNGRPVPGFLGYAVNSIDLKSEQLNIRNAAGHGLRETLFYRLFGELQIYYTRKHMEDALAYIKHGAVSLDGGIIREDGFFPVGHRAPTVCFPVTTANLSSECQGVLRRMESKREELRAVTKDIERVSGLCRKAMAKFNKLKAKHARLRHKMEPLLNEQSLEFHPTPAKSQNDNYIHT